MQNRNLVAPDGTPLMHRTIVGEDRTGRVAYVTHSQAQHSLNLRPTLEGIAARGWTVHSTDLRGHGFSSGPRAPLAHMDIDQGWERLVGDLVLGLSTAFEGVPWEDRMVVAPNIGAVLLLEALKEWPDLARSIVFIAPPPNQPTLLKLARSIVKARSLFHPLDEPDELTLHQLYTFLGARLSDRKRLIDVISSDRELTDALLEDEYAWPTPTTGYFYEMFRGIEKAWKWPQDLQVAEGTRLLILYGGDDPMTANGKFVGPMRRQLDTMGFKEIQVHCVEQGRSGLFIEEKHLGISEIIENWISGDGNAFNSAPTAEHEDLSGISTGVLNKLGLTDVNSELSTEELVELCYHAIDDESRWIEMLYRVTYALSADDTIDDGHLEALVHALMPHWDRSFQLNRQIMQSAAIGAVLQNVLDRFNLGMAIVSPDMAVTYSNLLFNQRLASLLGDETLAAGNVDAVSRSLRDCVGPDFVSRCHSGSGEALLVIGGEVVGFHFRPKALRQTALQRGGASGVLILRTRTQMEDYPADQTIELLQFAYGLTNKEAEVALCLLEGLSPDAIARRSDVTVNTIRTHLKRIYEKTGVQGQTELAARLLNGPVGLIFRSAGTTSSPAEHLHIETSEPR